MMPSGAPLVMVARTPESWIFTVRACSDRRSRKRGEQAMARESGDQLFSGLGEFTWALVGGLLLVILLNAALGNPF